MANHFLAWPIIHLLSCCGNRVRLRSRSLHCPASFWWFATRRGKTRGEGRRASDADAQFRPLKWLCSETIPYEARLNMGVLPENVSYTSVIVAFVRRKHTCHTRASIVRTKRTASSTIEHRRASLYKRQPLTLEQPWFQGISGRFIYGFLKWLGSVRAAMLGLRRVWTGGQSTVSRNAREGSAGCR